jgi:hypothetical protein
MDNGNKFLSTIYVFFIVTSSYAQELILLIICSQPPPPPQCNTGNDKHELAFSASLWSTPQIICKLLITKDVNLEAYETAMTIRESEKNTIRMDRSI